MSLMVDQTWRDQAGSPDRFGYEWGAYGDLLPEYEEQFCGWTVHLARADWRGLSFLSVGCGMVRNSYSPMIYGAREGVADDIGELSMEKARRHVSALPSEQVMRTQAFNRLV